MTPITRKRSRSSEEEDFLPLSKKINNLHINSWTNCGRKFVGENSEQLSQMWNCLPEMARNGVDSQIWQQMCSAEEAAQAWQHACTSDYNSGQIHNSLTPSCSTNVEQVPEVWPPPYAPDLSPEENPYYYNKNKLLYELYLARLQRTMFSSSTGP